MALIRVESFDHYASVTQRWSTGSFVPSIGSYGRRNTNGLRQGGGDEIGVSLGANEVVVYAGGAYKMVGRGWLFRVYESHGINHCNVYVRNDGTVEFWRGTDIALLGISTKKLPKNRFCYLEFLVEIGLSAAMEVRLDGQPFFSVTGVQTQRTDLVVTTTPDAFMTSVQFGAPDFNTSSVWQLDDLYLLNTTGAPASYLGDLQIEALFPTGAGAASGLTPVNNSPNYACVDESGSPNDETDYVEGGGASDTYAYSNLAAGAGTVHAVAVNFRARQSTAGPNTVAGKAGGSTGPGQTMLDTWKSFQEIFAGGWTVASVNSSEYGVSA